MMKSSIYRQIFATRIQRGQDRSLEFATTAGGWVYGATMAGSGVTGRGADLIIVDDPLAAKDADDPTKLAHSVAYFEERVAATLQQAEPREDPLRSTPARQERFHGLLAGSGGLAAACTSIDCR